MAEHLNWAGTGVTRRRLVRRLRMCLASHPREASGHRPPLLVGPPSVAGRGADERGRKPAGSGRKPPSGPEARSRAPKIAAVERREARHPTQISLRNLRRLDCVADVHARRAASQACLRRVTCWCAVRRSAPSDFSGEGMADRPRKRKTGACPSPEVQNTGRAEGVGLLSLSPSRDRGCRAAGWRRGG